MRIFASFILMSSSAARVLIAITMLFFSIIMMTTLGNFLGIGFALGSELDMIILRQICDVSHYSNFAALSLES